MLIDAEALERAERSLIAARDMVPEDRVLFQRAFMSKEGAEQFLSHHLSILEERYPELDPRTRPAIVTMFRHMLLVGAVAGRNRERSE
jgi:hypothetical protein